jgi:8-oxo-dGTP diphosphatase
MSDYEKFPTGKIKKGSSCSNCGRFNARYVTCDIILIRKDKVLLVLRAQRPQQDWWSLPGGYLNWDETLEECASREVKEEVGLDVKCTFFKTYSDPSRDLDGRQNIAHCFIARVNEGPLNLDAKEVKEASWFSLTALPKKIAFDHRKMIEEYNKTYKPLR